MVNHGNAVRKKARRKARKKARRKARRKAIRTLKYEDLTIDHDQCKKPSNKGTYKKVWIEFWEKTRSPDDTILWEDDNGNTHYR